MKDQRSSTRCGASCRSIRICHVDPRIWQIYVFSFSCLLTRRPPRAFRVCLLLGGRNLSKPSMWKCLHDDPGTSKLLKQIYGGNRPEISYPKVRRSWVSELERLVFWDAATSEQVGGKRQMTSMRTTWSIEASDSLAAVPASGSQMASKTAAVRLSNRLRNAPLILHS